MRYKALHCVKSGTQTSHYGWVVFKKEMQVTLVNLSARQLSGDVCFERQTPIARLLREKTRREQSDA